MCCLVLSQVYVIKVKGECDTYKVRMIYRQSLKYLLHYLFLYTKYSYRTNTITLHIAVIKT